MPTRAIYKRDREYAARVSKIALCMMAALAMSGDSMPACLMGMVHAQAHRRALQRQGKSDACRSLLHASLLERFVAICDAIAPFERLASCAGRS